MTAFFGILYYFAIGVCLWILPFAKHNWDTTHEINPNWSWNENHTTSVTISNSESFTFIECAEENPFLFVILIALLIVSLLLWIFADSKKNVNFHKPLKISLIVLGFIMLLAQWMMGFSLWGTIFVIFICYCPLKYYKFLKSL